MQSRRFIAGAVCPSCNKIDKLRYEKSPTHQRIDCVNCGYEQTLSLDVSQKIISVEEQ